MKRKRQYYTKPNRAAKRRQSINTKIKRQIASQSEKKFFDTSNETTGSMAGTNDDLLQIPQGDDYNQRVGRKITLRSVHLQGIAFVGVQTYSEGETLRLMLYLDESNTSDSPLQDNNYKSYLDLNETGNITPLYNEMIPLGVTTNDGSDYYYEVKSVNFNKRIDKLVQFNNTTAIDPIKNNLRLEIVSKNGNAVFNYTCRVRYTDS